MFPATGTVLVLWEQKSITTRKNRTEHLLFGGYITNIWELMYFLEYKILLVNSLTHNMDIIEKHMFCELSYLCKWERSFMPYSISKYARNYFAVEK